MKKIAAGHAGKLLGMMSQLFMMRTLRESHRARDSKHRPVEIDDTGPAAATGYLIQRQIHPGRASSLKKLNRANRIHNREAPQRYGVQGRRERTILKRAEKRALFAVSA